MKKAEIIVNGNDIWVDIYMDENFSVLRKFSTYLDAIEFLKDNLHVKQYIA